MDKMKSLPKEFFCIQRPNVTKAKDEDKIIPFEFPDNEKVKKGKYKNKVILKAVEKSNKR